MTLPGHFSGDLCIDPITARAVSLSSGADVFLYSDYEAVGTAEFPQSIRMMSDTEVREDSTITVREGIHFADSLFTPPANSAVSDFPACSEADKTSVEPRLDKKIQPEYPQNARMAHHQGTVWLYAIVAKDGSIQSLTPMHEIWPELDRSALEAGKGWRYTPYLRCGQTVEYETIISVNYSLSTF
jgi:TonB family protein